MRITIMGRGRMGSALARRLAEAGHETEMVSGRSAVSATESQPDVVLLTVPDAAIGETAARVAAGPVVGHFSGIEPLDLLTPHEGFSLHPLMTVTGENAVFAGAHASVAGTTDRARDIAEQLAADLGLVSFELADADRAVYHAAASTASNFLVTLEGSAERLAASAGVAREALAPLARAALENWAARGAAAALTGPIARGDEATVARQRAAVAERCPQDLALFDALTAATRTLAASSRAPEEVSVVGRGEPRVVRTVAELRAAIRDSRAAGSASVGFVPTMGALHEGHLSLVRRARAANDLVVLSIFVNPTQFNEAADLESYPRQEAADVVLAGAGGVDIVFAPAATEMYPSGYATTVHIEGPLTETLEGENRGVGHFDGMATIVSKLLLAVLPERAYFGEKDAQQLRVIRRMVADLGIPTSIIGCPTSRDDDGLARSSRNVRLSVADRAKALAIPHALDAMRAASSKPSATAASLESLGRELLTAAGLAVDYVACVDSASLAPEPALDGTAPVLCAIAARAGDVRLIDNTVLYPEAAGVELPSGP